MKSKLLCIAVLGALIFASCNTKKTKEVKEVSEEAVKHFEPTWESLQQYECPEWFQDAKFGIYTHWGVYSVPETPSDWYGHNMYFKEHPILFLMH